MVHLPVDAARLRDDENVFDALTPTVFHQPWWLNAATRGRYQEVTVETDGKAVGRFPYLLDRAFGGLSFCRMPELTHFLGPSIAEGRGNPSARMVRRMQITQDLLVQLPKTTNFYHKMHAGIDDMLVFQKLNYDVSVQFTYEIHPSSEDALWANMRDKTRNVIRRGIEALSLFEMTDPQEFLHNYQHNLAEAGTKNRYDRISVLNVITQALERHHGRILGARNKDGAIVAAIFTVWDNKSAYFLMSTRNAQAGNGAVSVLLWNAIRDATGRGLIFDFDGVGSTGNILFFTGFGGQTAPRYIARRSAALFAIARRGFRPYRVRGPQEFF